MEQVRGRYPLLDDIKRYLSQGECLTEPFVDAGLVFLDTDSSCYILVDINSGLISLHNIAKTRTDEYAQASRELFMPETNQAEVYYRSREEFNAGEDPFRRAALFLHLDRPGYNELYRYSLHGEFNVPFGRYKKPYFPEAGLYHFIGKTQNVKFRCLSYEECMSRTDDNSVVYCNPPYAPFSATVGFTIYHTSNSSSKEQVHLAEMAEKLVSKQIPVLIPNHDTPDTHERYRATEHFQVKMRRSISSDGGTRKRVSKLLALYKPGVVTPAKK